MFHSREGNHGMGRKTARLPFAVFITVDVRIFYNVPAACIIIKNINKLRGVL